MNPFEKIPENEIQFFKEKVQRWLNVDSQITQLESLVKDCDMLITGEGKIDLQTEKGKVISGICKLARKYKKSIIAVCGVKDEGISEKLGLNKIYTIIEIADSINDAVENGEKYLIDIGSKILTEQLKKP